MGELWSGVPRFVEPCLPSARATAPHGREWVHEIKHDGYRLIVRRDGKRACVFTRQGFDWTGRFPWIEDALRSLRARSATIDGEAVWFSTCLNWTATTAATSRLRDARGRSKCCPFKPREAQVVGPDICSQTKAGDI
jgi:ATP-dependent DNA ligase